MKTGIRIALGSFLLVPVLGLAWAVRDRVIECDRHSCLVQNRWTGVIHRVPVGAPPTERAANIAAGGDTTVAPSGALVNSYGHVQAFIERCREADVPASVCQSMAFEGDVLRREMERDREGPIGSSNRRVVRLSCIEHKVDSDVCWRWMPAQRN